MFRKVLVANRGEIAVRAFRAATELGARTVAVFPYEDRKSEHRLKADEAYQIGEPGHPVRAYLDHDSIVAQAVEAGVDAIYPGYGFLSENPLLAEACDAAGITFIGPPASVLHLTGNKARAIAAAREAGLPTLHGSEPDTDLDVLEDLAQGYAGQLKVQVAGPWTLAATVEKPRGDKVLSDLGARRELAQALAEGVRTHLADVRRRVPDAPLILQLDEPVLPAVLAGAVPTSSGFSRHRSVKPPEAAEALGWVLEAAGETPTVVHCCAADVPINLLRQAGAGGVSVDLAVLGASAIDELGSALDDGAQVHLGVVPSTGEQVPTTKATVERVLRLLDMIGFDPGEVSDRLVLTPSCGLAGATAAYAVDALRVVHEAARELG